MVISTSFAILDQRSVYFVYFSIQKTKRTWLLTFELGTKSPYLLVLLRIPTARARKRSKWFVECMRLRKNIEQTRAKAQTTVQRAINYEHEEERSGVWWRRPIDHVVDVNDASTNNTDKNVYLAILCVVMFERLRRSAVNVVNEVIFLIRV